MAVASVAVWRLRICRFEGLDAEAVAEIESGGMEGEAADVNPEIELVSRFPTTEALEEIAANLNREATIVGVGRIV